MTNEEFAGFIREAIEREREACARIAEGHFFRSAERVPPGIEAMSPDEIAHAVMFATGSRIAEAIRNGTETSESHHRH